MLCYWLARILFRASIRINLWTWRLIKRSGAQTHGPNCDESCDGCGIICFKCGTVIRVPRP